MTAHRGKAVVMLEVEEVRVVGKTRNRLAHVHGLAIVLGHHAEKFVRCKARRLAGRKRRCFPSKAGKYVARIADAVRIVLGKVFPEPRHMGMHQRAAEFFIGGDLAGRRF